MGPVLWVHSVPRVQGYATHRRGRRWGEGSRDDGARRRGGVGQMAAFLVYAAGPIRGATYDEAEGWREKAARRLAPYDIHVLSPMRGKDYLKTVGLLGGPSGTGGAPESVVANEKAIFRRDRWDVERS